MKRFDLRLKLRLQRQRVRGRGMVDSHCEHEAQQAEQKQHDSTPVQHLHFSFFDPHGLCSKKEHNTHSDCKPAE